MNSFQKKARYLRSVWEPRSKCCLNILKGRPTVYGVTLERPPAMVVRTRDSGALISHVFVDGGSGAALEVKTDPAIKLGTAELRDGDKVVGRIVGL